MLKEAYELNKNDPNPWKGACRAFFKNSLEEGEDVELDIGSSLASDWQLQSTYARCKAELMCGATYVFRAYTNKFTDIGDKVNFLRSEASDEITCKVKECNGQCANDNAYWLDRGLIKGWPVDFVVLGLRVSGQISRNRWS
jgi:hypothetical protein